MYIAKAKSDKAIESFERVLELSPNNYETMKILASLYSRTTSRTLLEKAAAFFKKVRTVGGREEGAV